MCADYGVVAVASDRAQKQSRARIRAHHVRTRTHIHAHDDKFKGLPPSYIILLLHRFARGDGQPPRVGVRCMVAGGF